MTTITGSCHCGDTQFAIEAEIPAELTRCTCSFCAKRGALLAYYPPEVFKVTGKGEHDAYYLWNTRQVLHHFCNRCGVSVYSDSPAFEMDGKWDGKTRRVGVNARLFDNFDAAEAKVTVIDGKHLW